MRALALASFLVGCSTLTPAPADLSRINRAAIAVPGDCKDYVRAVLAADPSTRALITCPRPNTDCHASALVARNGINYVLDDGQLFGGPSLVITFDQYRAFMKRRPGARYGVFDVEILRQTRP